MSLSYIPTERVEQVPDHMEPRSMENRTSSAGKAAQTASALMPVGIALEDDDMPISAVVDKVRGGGETSRPVH